MSTASTATTAERKPTIRRDLQSVSVQAQGRPYRIVIDELAGRFTRVSEKLWRQLHGDQSLDEETIRQARAAGLTRERQTRTKRFTPLAIQIPLGSIDDLAKKLARHSGFLYSPLAICIWTSFIFAMAIAVLSRSSQLGADLANLSQYFSLQTTALAATLFVITKSLHELGHAVMCRRIGARCKSVGVMLFCGFPCPYCDVTDIWRQPSTSKRVGVMLAGIYTELILAALASLVWMLSSDPWARVSAINVMLVCSVSTLLFNANPLMRYDGYYVLADLMRSVNLRREATEAVRSVVVARLAGVGYAFKKRFDLRSSVMAIYGIASYLYRLVVTVVIAAFFVSLLAWINLEPIAVVAVACLFLMAMVRSGKRALSVMAGTGLWSRVPLWRRSFVMTLIVAGIIGILFFPLPRYRKLSGVIQASDTDAVFVPQNGLIDSVQADFGDPVTKGQTLLQLGKNELRLEEMRLLAERNQTRLRRQHADLLGLQQSSTPSPEILEQWSTLLASEKAIEKQLADVKEQLERATIRSPETGVLIPGESQKFESASLHSAAGKVAVAGEPWCRVAHSGELTANIVLDGIDRERIAAGTMIRIQLLSDPTHVIETNVATASSLVELESTAFQQTAFVAICRLPPVNEDDLMWWVGQRCRATVELERRSLATDVTTWLESWFRG